MKIVKNSVIAAAVFASAFGAYQYGRISQEPIIKEVVKNNNVYIRDTAYQEEAKQAKAQMQSVIDQLEGRRKIFIEMLIKNNINFSNINVSALQSEMFYLALTMYRECGICNDHEKAFIGLSMNAFVKRGVFEDLKNPTFKQMVNRYKVFKDKKTGEMKRSYFVSFAGHPSLMNIPPEKHNDGSITEEAYKQYTQLALAIYFDLPQVEYQRSVYYEITNNKQEGVYWCNAESSGCYFHFNYVTKNPFKLNFAKELMPIIYRNQQSYHYFFYKEGL
jgi:hypothetical protein